MKFELIKPVVSSYSIVEQILINRNIPRDQIEHYLNTTEEDVNPPEAFGEDLLRAAAALIIQTVQANKHMAVIVD